MIPALIGGACGVAIVAAFYRNGLLRERGGLTVLVCAIAAFYPVFAVQSGASVTTLVLHSAAFLAICALAAYGHRQGTRLLAFLLIGHGVFDAALAATAPLGPPWWPAFCGVLDVTAGALILLLLSQKRVPA